MDFLIKTWNKIIYVFFFTLEKWISETQIFIGLNKEAAQQYTNKTMARII